MGARLDVCPDDENMCEEQPAEPCPGPSHIDGHEIHLLGNRRDFDEFFFSFDGASVQNYLVHAAPESVNRGRRSGELPGGRGAIAREIMDSLMKDPGFPVEDDADEGGSSSAAGIVLPFGPVSSFRSASRHGSFASLSSFGSFASAMSAKPLVTGAPKISQQSKQQHAKKSILRLVSSLMKGSIVIMHSDAHGLTECTMQLDRGLSVLEFRKQGVLLLNLPLASVEEATLRSRRTVKLVHGAKKDSFILELDDENECHVFVACVHACAKLHRASLLSQN